jgi:uncharacterized protein YdaU (DUF1376 family)
MYFNIIDWLLDDEVQTMTPLARAGYFDLLCRQWYDGGLPDDPKKLQIFSRLDKDQWEEVSAEILPHFKKCDDGLLRQGRLDETRQEALLLLDSRREAGQKGGLRKAQKDKRSQQGYSKAKAKPQQSPSDPMPIRGEDKKEDDRIEENNKKRQRGPQAAGAFGPEKLQEIWNEAASKSNLQRCEKLTQKRKNHAKARIREQPSEQVWRRVIASIRDCKWCNGESDKGWRANFDYLIRPDTHIHAVEGKFRKKRAIDFVYKPIPPSEADIKMQKWKKEKEEEIARKYGVKNKTDGGVNNTSGYNKIPSNASASPSTKDGAGNKSVRNLEQVSGGSPRCDHRNKAARTNLRVSPQDPGPIGEVKDV